MESSLSSSQAYPTPRAHVEPSARTYVEPSAKAHEKPSMHIQSFSQYYSDECRLCSVNWDLLSLSGDLTLTKQKCGHEFHDHCLSQWIKENNIRHTGFAEGDQLKPIHCPTCKRALEHNSLQQQRLKTINSVLEQCQAAHDTLIETTCNIIIDLEKNGINPTLTSSLEWAFEKYLEIKEWVKLRIPTLIDAVIHCQPKNATAEQSYITIYSYISLHQFVNAYQQFPEIQSESELLTQINNIQTSKKIMDEFSKNFKAVKRHLDEENLNGLTTDHLLSTHQIAFTPLVDAFESLLLASDLKNSLGIGVVLLKIGESLPVLTKKILKEKKHSQSLQDALDHYIEHLTQSRNLIDQLQNAKIHPNVLQQQLPFVHVENFKAMVQALKSSYYQVIQTIKNEYTVGN